MSKTAYQIQNFLSVQPIKSDNDWKYISAICREHKDLKLTHNIEYDQCLGLCLSEFTDWLENGFGCGDISNWEGVLVILGQCSHKSAMIVGILKSGVIESVAMDIDPQSLKHATTDEEMIFRHTMIAQRVQFGLKELKLIDKYIPRINERIIFHNNSERGLGVVRDIDFKTGEVELYCYYLFGTKSVGYSMHEKGICTLNEFIFEPMDNSDNRQTSGNGISLQRKLNRELERCGKIWNQRLCRIEPISPMVDVGQTYWYINDTMNLVEAKERGTITSRRRYFAGNYFKTHEEGLETLGKMAEVLRDRLAEPCKVSEN